MDVILENEVISLHFSLMFPMLIIVIIIVIIIIVVWMIVYSISLSVQQRSIHIHPRTQWVSLTLFHSPIGKYT